LGIWEILEILESWTKSGNISALTEALADKLEILENQTESWKICNSKIIKAATHRSLKSSSLQ
jgi:hypothetical protein